MNNGARVTSLLGSFTLFSYDDKLWLGCATVKKVVVRGVRGTVRITTQGNQVAVGRSGDEKQWSTVMVDIEGDTLTLTGDFSANWSEEITREVAILLVVPGADKVEIVDTSLVQFESFRGEVGVDPTCQTGGRSTSKTSIHAVYIGDISGNARELRCLAVDTVSLNVADLRQIGCIWHP